MASTTVQERCYATAACTASIEVSVPVTGDLRQDHATTRLLLEAHGWGQGLHGLVCPAHRPGEFHGL